MGDMGCNVLSPIDILSPTKSYSRDSVSEFQAGFHSVITAAKLDANNATKPHDLVNADAAKADKIVANTTASVAVHTKTNIVVATIMVSEAIAVQSSITNDTVTTTPTSEAITFNSSVKVAAAKLDGKDTTKPHDFTNADDDASKADKSADNAMASKVIHPKTDRVVATIMSSGVVTFQYSITNGVGVTTVRPPRPPLLIMPTRLTLLFLARQPPHPS
jgi:hypothetical protein